MPVARPYQSLPIPSPGMARSFARNARLLDLGGLIPVERRTLRWRKADSNRRSPPANELVSSAGHACAPGAKDGLLAVVYLAGTKGSLQERVQPTPLLLCSADVVAETNGERKSHPM